MKEQRNRWELDIFKGVNPGAGLLLHDKLPNNPRAPDYFGIYKFEEDAHYKEGDILRVVGWTSKSGKVIGLKKENDYIAKPEPERRVYYEVKRGGADDIPF